MEKKVYDDLFKQFNDSLNRISEKLLFENLGEILKQIKKERENLNILYYQYSKKWQRYGEESKKKLK